MKIKLKNPNSCDGCNQLEELNTLGQHKKCKLYGKVMLPMDDVSMAIKKVGRLERPQVCKDENEVE